MLKQMPRENAKDGEEPVQVSYLPKRQKPRFGEKLARNTALMGMLLLTVVSVRNAQLPSGETVLSAVQDMIDTTWDERLGKISFVSNLLPETVAVFFEAPYETDLAAPCFGEITHVFSESEPYIGYDAMDAPVYAVADGQVMSVAHGLSDEKIVRVRHDDGLETMYYNLADVYVSIGSQVKKSEPVGRALSDQGAAIEVRRAGRAIDPTNMLRPLEGSTP